jgi:hypothetical protein
VDDPFRNSEDAIRELMFGKEGVLERRRKAELEHERQLAAIRREGHAPQPAPASTKQGAEIERRKKLLADYKAATGNPSSSRIYKARNSRIHKPEFYQWLNGGLSADSATTISFERFLQEKKPPLPSKPKS